MRCVVGTIVLWSVVATAGKARATPLDAVLLPSAPLAADGERAHRLRVYCLDGDALLPGLPTVHAARGSIVTPPSASSDGGATFTYRPPRVATPGSDTLTVALRGRETRLQVALEPAGRVRVTVEVPPGNIFVGKGQPPTTVKLHVRDAAGRPAPAPLRVGTSVGKVTAAREVAVGEYQFDYQPPEERYPQVAIVAALSIADGAFAAVPVKLFARVTVDGEAEPGATMVIGVDGHDFPAAQVGADGRFSIPLVVPPGGHASGVSTDKLGNRQKRDIDLGLPSFPRLLIGAVPSTLPADGESRAEVVEFAVDARGNPEKRAAPVMTADAGTLSPPTARGDGWTTWTLTAPAALGPGYVGLHAPGGEGRIGLKPGPPKTIEVVPPPEPLPAGSPAPVAIEVRLRDAAGSPVPGAALTATLAGGRVVGVHDRGAGRYAVDVIPPRDASRANAALHVEVTAVPPGPPRRVTMHPLPPSNGEVGAEAWVDDDAGLPVPDAQLALAAPGADVRVTSDRYGTARIHFPAPSAHVYRVTAQPATLPGLHAALDLLVVGGVLHAVPSTVGGGVISQHDVEPPSFPQTTVPILLRPAANIDVRLSVDPKQVHAGQPVTVTIEMRAGDPSQLLYEVSGGSVEVVRPPAGGSGELRFTPPDDARPGDRFILSVTDGKTHVTTFTEVRVQ